MNALKAVDYDDLLTNALTPKHFVTYWEAAKDDRARQILIDKIVKAVIVKDSKVQSVELHGGFLC